MNKLFLFLAFSLNTSRFFSQTLTAIQYYDVAVNYFNLQNYRLADSLFSLSIHIEPHKDTYFSRASSRLKLGNKNGYCEDLAYASSLGDSEAKGSFLKNCGKIDTLFIKLNQKFSETTIFSRAIVYKYNDSLTIVFKQKYYSQDGITIITPIVNIGKEPEVFKPVETAAEFPGGISALSQFLQKNILIPVSLNQDIKPLRVYLKYIVFEDGTLHDITIINGIKGCPECDEEATRLVAIMPKWKPAAMGDKPVKCYFNLPISFKKIR